MPQKNVIEFYDSIAPGYDREQEEFSFVRLPEREAVNSILKNILRGDLSVLEIGAGTGRFTLEIAPLVKKVDATDISQNMLDLLAKKAEEKAVRNVTSSRGDFLEMSFAEKYDLIVSFSAIEYINDPRALFAKISGLLKPGGQLLLTTAHDTFFRFWGRLGNYFRQGVFIEAYSKRKMKKLLRANGMEAKELTDMCMKTFFTKGILLLVRAVKKP